MHHYTAILVDKDLNIQEHTIHRYANTIVIPTITPEGDLETIHFTNHSGPLNSKHKSLVVYHQIGDQETPWGAQGDARTS